MDDDLLRRATHALERLAPPPAGPVAEDAAAYVWRGEALAASDFRPLALDLLTGIDAQKAALLTNTRRHAGGHAAHDVLLWGVRGSGKSALIKAVVGHLRNEAAGLALVELAVGDIASLPALLETLSDWSKAVILFVDDLGFDDGDGSARLLRSVLDGGSAARPPHVRIYVTSNRRHVVARDMAEQDSAINPRDVAEDRLALADRFGLSLGFHACDQESWLAMVAGYARWLGLDFDQADAIAFATQRGSRSGRVAWHYAVELAGRAGRALPIGYGP